MSKTRILLTGGGGMVGRNLLGSAGAAKFEISAPSSKDVNLLDYSATLDHMRQFKPDMVIHTAGLVGGIQANLENPFSFLVENLDLGRNVVMAAREVGVPQLMNLGSSCMYPRDIDTPLSEDMILTGELEPTNEGYALAKIAVARMCRYLSAQDDRFDYKTLIPCNLFGPFDNFDPVRSHLVPAIIFKVHQAKTNNLTSVEIWGDGSARREFMSAGKLVEFIWHAMDRFETLPDLLNVGMGKDHSILEYYETVAKVLNWQGEFTFDLDRPVGMKRKLISTVQLSKTGWQATASLEDGIRETYRYFQEHVIEGNA
ncbi:MAG: GDP-L-fucose synthase [Rhizobiaceae bacterium]|nr:GDP-L-fucose synthase [Rhizobiaceae bacterium]